MTDEIESTVSVAEASEQPLPLRSDYDEMCERWAERASACVATQIGAAVLLWCLLLAASLDGFNPFAILFIFLILAQIAVAAMWLGLGRAALGLRLLAVTLPVLVIVATIGRSQNWPELFGFAVIAIALLAAPAAIAKVIGLHLVLLCENSQCFTPVRTNLRQFSLLQLFGLMTFVAVVAAMFKSGILQFPQIDRELYLRQCAVFAAIITLVLAAAWAVLSGIPGAVIGTMCASFIVTLAIFAPVVAGEFDVLFCIVVLIMQLLVMLVLLPFRLAGFRLRWTPSDIAPMDSKTATPTS